MRLLSEIILYPINKIDNLILKHSLKRFGSLSYINNPLRIQGPQNISIGNNVRISQRAWLASLPIAGEREANLIFNDGCVIGDYNHIWCSHSITFEKDVLTANHVYVSDNLHKYGDVSVPVVNQPIKQLKSVVIGEGSWLGENVCVIGACIGKHCVIGANSVVTHDIPDYCVAAGVPAKVIKRYDSETRQWIKL